MDIILYFAKLKDYPLDKARQRALQYLEKFDLKGKEKAKIEELSKGMAQKVQFIASIVHDPDIIVLDEPFSGLDPVSQDVFKTEIKQLAADGKAILLSAHQMNLVEELCDRIYMINRGQKILYGHLDKIKETYANFKCDIVGDNGDVDLAGVPGVERVVRGARQLTLHLTHDANPLHVLKALPEQLRIDELKIDRISLHDIFVSVAKGGTSDENVAG